MINCARRKWIAVAGFLAVVASNFVVAVGGDSRPPDRRYAENEPGWELLGPDAAWCGPRILFFFARYAGKSVTLDEVISLCQTDESGHTSLQALVTAAEALGLNPTPVECDIHEIFRLGGPAILCVHTKRSSGDDKTNDIVHFVGYVTKNTREFIVDPSVDPRAVPASISYLATAYRGKAVLLAGCPRPDLRSPLVESRWFLSGLAIAAVSASIMVWFGIPNWLKSKCQPRTAGGSP